MLSGLSTRLDPQLDRYEAAEILQDTYSVYPPINIRSMTYTYDTQKEQFLEKYGLDTDLSAEDAFSQLRETYKIDETLSDTEARKLFRIREEIQTLDITVTFQLPSPAIYRMRL